MIRDIRPDPDIQHHGVSISVKNEHKFVCIIFVEKWIFIRHIKLLKHKCIKTMSRLKVLSHIYFGADKLLLPVFPSQIVSQLSYGSFVFGSANKTSLRMINSLLHRGLRFSFGAFQTNPVERLHEECKKWSLERQWVHTDLFEDSKILTLSHHPFTSVLMIHSYLKSFLIVRLHVWL